MKKLIVSIFLFICILFSCCDNGIEQINEPLLGTWEFNKTEYIKFMESDIFIMNDSIQGQYDMDSEDDTEIYYYYCSESEETEGDGYMFILNKNGKAMTVKSLPLHEEEIIKMTKK